MSHSVLLIASSNSITAASSPARAGGYGPGGASMDLRTPGAVDDTRDVKNGNEGHSTQIRGFNFPCSLTNLDNDKARTPQPVL